MFPLPIVLAGSCERTLPNVRRELANLAATIEAEFSQVADLLIRRAEFRAKPTLFIFHVQGPKDLASLKRLAGAFVGRPIVALVDDGKDPAVLIAAMREGACQVVPLPLAPADFKAALDCISVQFGHAAEAAQVLAVSGCTGGCGATSLAVNLAYEIAHLHDKRVILAELSPRIGMLVTYLDAEPKYTFEDLYAYDSPLDVHVVEQTLVRVSDRLSFLTGSERPLPTGPDLTGKIETVLDYLRCLADVVILDFPCTFDEGYFQVLGLANKIVLVGEQRIPSVRNLQLILSTFKGKGGDARCLLALNRYDPAMEGFTTRELAKLLHTPHIATLANDPARMTAAQNQGKPIRLSSPRSPVVADVDGLARVLIDSTQTSAPHRKSPSVFGKLFHACGLV
jgi:pilus assembly protein CpaE